MRVLVLALVLALAGIVVADDGDDDEVLDSRPLGESIPDRMKTLEREWARDVGAAEPPSDDPDAAASPPAHGEGTEPDGDEPYRPEGESDEPTSPPRPPEGAKAAPPVRDRREPTSPSRPSSRPPVQAPAARTTHKQGAEHTPTDPDD